MDIALAFLSALAFALGNVLQKMGLSRLHGSAAVWKETLRSTWWWMGMGTTILAVLLSYWVTAHASLSVVQPIICLNPILTVLFARHWVGEKFSPSPWPLLFLALGLAFFAMCPSEASDRGQHYALFLGSALGLGVLVTLGVRALDLRWALLSGLGFALSPVLYKGLLAELGSVDFELGPSLAFALIHSPSLLPFVGIYFFAFIASQIALYHGRVSVVVPISAGLGALGSALAGVLVFGEDLGIAKIVAFVFLSVALLTYKDK